MQITPVNFSDKNKQFISFSAGFNPAVQKMFKETSMNEVQDYFKKRDIQTMFAGNENTAKIAYFTAKIFEKLGLPLPSHISTFKFQNMEDDIPIDHTLDGCALYAPLMRSKKIEKHVLLNTEQMENIESWDKECNHNNLCSSSFLGVAIHEFAHINFFERFFKKFGIDKKTFFQRKPVDMNVAIVNLEQISINFIKWLKPVIANNVSPYASKNIKELYAEIMTQDIVNSIDELTLLPKTSKIVSVAHREILLKKLQDFMNNPPQELATKPEKIDFNKILGLN